MKDQERPRRRGGITDEELASHLARRAGDPTTDRQRVAARLVPAVRARLQQPTDPVRPRMRGIASVVPGAVVLLIVAVIAAAWGVGLPGLRSGHGPTIGASTAVAPSDAETVPPTVGPSRGPTPTPMPTLTFDADIRPASWELVPGERPTGDDRHFRVFVTERECASGRSPEGRIVGPAIEWGRDDLTVTFAVRRLPGGQDCPGNPGFPVTVFLDGPIGDRLLVDGGVTPHEPRGPRALPELLGAASAIADDFTLSIRTPKTAWGTGEPIQVATSVVYAGSLAQVTATSREPAPHLVGWSIRQADGDWSFWSPGQADDTPACHTVRLERDRALDQPFSKPTGYDPSAHLVAERFAAYLADPDLRLPPGTWTIEAVLSRGPPCEAVELYLAAAIVIRTE